jgi:four helix bundle protein
MNMAKHSLFANLAEAWRKSRYLAAFVSKLSGAETEAAETQVYLEVALRHRYITSEIFDNLDDACDTVLGQIVAMIDHADRWIIKPRRNIRNG